MSSADDGIRGFHLVRYGTAADQKYLERPFLNTYDQIVINANMVAHMPGALASFLLQKTKNKPYFIDPQTHAFQHDISYLESTGKKSAGKIKKSISTLIEAYGEPLLKTIKKNRRSLLPRDFNDKARFKEFCARVSDFQLNRIEDEAVKSDASKYYKFLERKGKITDIRFKPTLVVAPYFYMTSNTYQEWKYLNFEAIGYVKDHVANMPVAAQIVISKDLLINGDFINELANGYQRHQPSVYLLWIDNFSEQQVNKNELENYIDLINKLGKKAPVVNLYGGLFSIALKKSRIVPSLAGVCHGLEYGEYRGVIPVGGGIPFARFYFPMMHKRLKFREAYRAIKKIGGMGDVSEFHATVCDCPECKLIITNDPDKEFATYGRSRPLSFIRRNQPIVMEYPLSETRDHCVRHYMWCKEREYKPSFQFDKIIADLKRSERFKGTLGLEDIAYVTVWKEILLEKAKSV